MPIIIGIISIEDEVRYRVNNSTTPEIEIAGMPTRKESLAAVCLSIPENKAEVKVTPDLETPGNIASVCETPKNIISLSLMSLNNFFFVLYFSETASNRDIDIETIAIEKKPLKYESEKSIQNNLMNNPTNKIGRLAKKI